MGIFNGLLQLGAGFLGKSLIGGPWGFVIGNLIGGILFAPKAEQPKVKALDLKLQKTEYGTFEPIYYGTVRAAGIVFDCDAAGGVIKVKKVKKVSTGLFSSTKVTSFKYYLSCAILFGEGVFDAEGNGRLLIDMLQYGEDVIYDRNATTDKKRGFIMAADAILGGERGRLYDTTPQDPDHKLALYSGTWTQQPEPWLAELHNGVVPAYRGQAFAALKMLPLGRFDNELRPLTARMRRVDKDGATIEEIERMVFFHLKRGGMSAERLSLSKLSQSVNATVDGSFMTQKGAPRELAERLANYAFCDLAQIGDKIVATSRATPSVFALSRHELNAKTSNAGSSTRSGSDDDDSGTKITHDVNGELPSELTVTFQDSTNNYEVGTAVATRQTATHQKPESIDMPIVARPSKVRRWAKVALDEAWEARKSAEVSLLPRRLEIAPGDVIEVPSDTTDEVHRIRVASQTAMSPGAIKCEGKGWSEHVYNQPYLDDDIVTETPGVKTLEVPTLFIFQTVPLISAMQSKSGVLLAASAPASQGWAGAYFDASGVQGSVLGDESLPDRATMGTTLSVFPIGRTTDYDTGASLLLQPIFGLLANTTDSLGRQGANTLIVGKRVIRFKNATLNGNGTILISGIWDGLFGSDIGGTLPVGTPWALIRDENNVPSSAVVWSEASGSSAWNSVGLVSWTVSAGDDDDEGPKSSVQYLGIDSSNLKCLSPVRPRIARTGILSSDTTKLAFDPRTRDVESGESFWSSGQGPVLSDPLTFQIVLDGPGSELTRTRFVSGSTEATWTNAQLSFIFGNVPSTLSGTIYQINSLGRGYPRRFENL